MNGTTVPLFRPLNYGLFLEIEITFLVLVNSIVSLSDCLYCFVYVIQILPISLVSFVSLVILNFCMVYKKKGWKKKNNVLGVDHN